MKIDKYLSNLLENAKKCTQNDVPKRPFLNDFLESFESFLVRNFPSNDNRLDDEEFLGKLKALQYATYALVLVSEKCRFTVDDLYRFFQLVITSNCAFNDEELSSCFQKILSVLVAAACKLDGANYDSVLMSLLEVFRFCEAEKNDSIVIPKLLTRKTFARIESCVTFKTFLSQNILGALFEENAENKCNSDVFLLFWPQCFSTLKKPTSSRNILFTKNCLRAGLKTLRICRRNESTIEQAKQISQLLTSIQTVHSCKNEIRDVVTEIIEEIYNFMKSNDKALVLSKELVEQSMEWMNIYLKLIGDTSDDLGILDAFSEWIVEYTSNHDSSEVKSKHFVVPIETCVRRIKLALNSSSTDCLHNYIDILASLFKHNRMQRQDSFNWMIQEIQKHHSLDNPRWPRILASLLSVQNPSCHNFCKKFAPSMDQLWTKLKAGESSKTSVFSMAIVLSSCSFLTNNDEFVKQILPLLLVPCLHDFRERVGTRWDNFRIIGAQKAGVAELVDLEKVAPMIESSSMKLMKRRSIQCALQIDRKSGKYINLVADMTLAVLSKSSNEEVAKCLPALEYFLIDHQNFANEFVALIIGRLCDQTTSSNEKTLIEMYKCLRRMICIAANGKKSCPKCDQSSFVKSDSKESINLDERSVSLFMKAFIESRKKHAPRVIKEFLKTCRSILMHVHSKNIVPAFTPIVKLALEIGFTENADDYFLVWELISWRSNAKNERKMVIYVPVFARALSAIKDENTLDNFLEKVLEAKFSKVVKVAVFAAIFSHSVIKNSEISSQLVSKWAQRFACRIVEGISDITDEEQCRKMCERYSTVFTRSFLFRLFLETTLAGNNFDESVIRKTARSFVLNVLLHFKFRNLALTISVLRPTLVYWTLISGSSGANPKHVCSVIDFVCQELGVISTTSLTNPNGMNVIYNQRKALITELFPLIQQFSALDSFKKGELLWKFCEEYCAFKEEDMKSMASTFRKKVFEHILLVTPQDFNNPKNSSPVVIELQKIYENMKKNEKFNLSSAIDTRNEGVEFLLTFRQYFIKDAHYWMRESVATSFRLVLESFTQDFLNINWWTILQTLRHSPPNSDSTVLSWITFLKRVDYEILRTNIWRFLCDLSRVSSNEKVFECIWERLSYANEIDKITVDDVINRVFWVIPLEVEKKVDINFIIPKSRRIEDVFEFIRQFPQYPSLQFANNLASKIDRGTIWKDDLTKLMGALVGIIPNCPSSRQQNQLFKLLQKVPIIDSEMADRNFVRWDSKFTFFAEPNQLTQAVLEECVNVVEILRNDGKIEYADRTMCEVQRFISSTGCSRERAALLDALKQMFARMNCSHKPDPVVIEQKTIEEHSLGGLRSQSFNKWLTILILKCSEMSEEAPLSLLIHMAHLSDSRFLARLAMRFIITIIHMERDSVADWILSLFNEALTDANEQVYSKSHRQKASFIFYVFDFLYAYVNSEEILKNRKIWTRFISFWKRILEWSVNDEHGHEQPLIVKVAERFGMEKRCIFWMEMVMEQMRIDAKRNSEAGKKGVVGSEIEAVYYFTLMKLYARIHELNGVRGSHTKLTKAQNGHIYGKICFKEAFGDVAEASSLSKMTGKGRPFDPTETIQKLIEEQNSRLCPHTENLEQEDYIKSLKSLTEWVKIENDSDLSPQVFRKNIEARSSESTILQMLRNGESNEKVDEAIQAAKSTIAGRISECAIGGSCSYETAVPYIVQIQQLDEMVKLRDVSNEDLVGFENHFWRSLQKRVTDGEQTMSVLEPILRVRRSMLDIRMKSLGDRDKDHVRSRIVEAHLQSVRIARLSGCLEKAQLSLINAKKILPFENKIVLEEAKLQLQSSDALNGMSLLDGIITKNFGDLHNIYGDTQQSGNVTLQNAAKMKIENYPVETKNLFSSVQMLRISHMIKAGNTVGFEKIYNETTHLLNCFAHSGVMYEAAWLLDYLFHYNERAKHVLPLLKAYAEVAKYETNRVLQARAVERMTSLWLSNTRKISNLISGNSKMPEGQISDLKQNINSMNREVQVSFDKIGWRACYPAYAILARHIDHQDEEVYHTIKNLMVQLILRMPHQCMWQSVYLLRLGNAQIEKKYMDVLSHVKRKAPCFVTLIDQYDYASGIFNKVSGNVSSDACKLSEKVEGFQTLFRDRKYDSKQLKMNRRLEDVDCKVLSGIMLPIRSVIDESVHEIELSERGGYEEACHLPDRYLIHDFNDSVKVLHSKTKPVLIELVTMAGRKVRLICKKDDDLTKDYHFTKIVEMCNDLLMKDEQTKIQRMPATTYSVIPLANKGGILEFIEGVQVYYDSLDSLMHLSNTKWGETIQSWNKQMSTKSKEDRADFFRNVACENTPLVMAKWFRLQYPEAGKWFASRKLFAKSTAVMSIIGYIFGLGDRHTRNLMIHLATGKCIHVDFDMIFNKGESQKVPEVVPFRLTRNMINGMGEVALEGEFRSVCEQTLRVFRENSYEIEKYIADLPDLVDDFEKDPRHKKEYDMTEAKRLVSGRIRGQIMTAKLYRSNPISHPMQVSQLASSLIELATSDEKLSEMFFGWMPTL